MWSISWIFFFFFGLGVSWCWTNGKCEIKKKKKEELIYVFAFEVYGFLTIHVVTLLELEIYRAFIKLLDQTEKKAKKT